MRNLTIKENLRLNEVKEKIKIEMLNNGIFYKKSSFACYNDSVFTYNYITKSKILIETSFICEDTLLDKLSFKEIIELKRIVYLTQKIYTYNLNTKQFEFLNSVNFTLDN